MPLQHNTREVVRGETSESPENTSAPIILKNLRVSLEKCNSMIEGQEGRELESNFSENDESSSNVSQPTNNISIPVNARNSDGPSSMLDDDNEFEERTIKALST